MGPNDFAGNNDNGQDDFGNQQVGQAGGQQDQPDQQAQQGQPAQDQSDSTRTADALGSMTH